MTGYEAEYLKQLLDNGKIVMIDNIQFIEIESQQVPIYNNIDRTKQLNATFYYGKLHSYQQIIFNGRPIKQQATVNLAEVLVEQITVYSKFNKQIKNWWFNS